MLHEDFLPPEYVEHRQDCRMHVIGLVLFGVVVVAVVVAFFVKQAEWNRVNAIRDNLASRHVQVVLEMNTISALEATQADILGRAIIAASLVERLPRSTLLAEITNRMPTGLGLLEFDLHTKVVEKVETDAAPGRSGRSQSTQPTADTVITVIGFRTNITMLGFAPTDLHVSEFLSELNGHPLIEDVMLRFSEETEIEHQSVRQFRITCSLGPTADIRSITLLRMAPAGTSLWTNVGPTP
jgi:hypothetical protein